MIYVANPLYDAVFKYLMEDDRVAKTILSALLKKKVLEVKMRSYGRFKRTSLNINSNYRINFAATVVEEDGKAYRKFIELQKTWFPTGTLICYVTRHLYNYDGDNIKDGVPYPFVERLPRDSIIVQMSQLRNIGNYRLKKMLSFFDQTNTADNKKVIRMDESQIEGDDDMEYIVHRLQAAAADPDMRIKMNIEDEYFKLLEYRDMEIMKKDAILKEQEATMKEQNSMLKTTIQGLLDNGMSVDAVAKMLGKSENDVKTILEK